VASHRDNTESMPTEGVAGPRGCVGRRLDPQSLGFCGNGDSPQPIADAVRPEGRAFAQPPRMSCLREEF
jgi:hypothetical protein